jgi:hypothetical protein
MILQAAPPVGGPLRTVLCFFFPLLNGCDPADPLPHSLVSVAVCCDTETKSNGLAAGTLPSFLCSRITVPDMRTPVAMGIHQPSGNLIFLRRRTWRS